MSDTTKNNTPSTPAKSKALSNAERQRRHRLKATSAVPDAERNGRINTFVSSEVAASLDLLAQCYKVSKKEILECLIKQAEHKTVQAAAEQKGDVTGSAYFQRKINLDLSVLKVNK